MPKSSYVTPDEEETKKNEEKRNTKNEVADNVCL